MILVMTSAKYNHLLQGFCYMFNDHSRDEEAIIATDVGVTVDLSQPDAVLLAPPASGLVGAERALKLVVRHGMRAIAEHVDANLHQPAA